MWGTTLTPAIVNSTNFGSSIVVFNNDGSFSKEADIEYVEISIYYEDGPPPVQVVTKRVTFFEA